jgi:hypothetical protein
MRILPALCGILSFLCQIVSSQSTNTTSSTNTTTAATGPITVSNTILVFARDQPSSYSATSGLNGYGIPYQVVLVPQAGTSIPTLNSTVTNGNYGGIIVLSEVSYGYPDGSWHSALTTDQWNQLYDYQIAFNVRMVRIDVYPDNDFGKLDSLQLKRCQLQRRNNHGNPWPRLL